jgi:hypothetical protein
LKRVEVVEWETQRFPSLEGSGVGFKGKTKDKRIKTKVVK